MRKKDNDGMKWPLKRNAEKHIQDMKLGETGWCVLWAFNISNGRFWIKGNYPITEEMLGTCNVKIKRVADGITILESHADKPLSVKAMTIPEVNSIHIPVSITDCILKLCIN